MNNPKKSQYAAIEYPFPLEEPPVVYCPVCGCNTYQLEESGNWELNPCQHLAFIFVGISSAFEYQSKDFQEKAGEKQLEGLSFDHIKDLVDSLGYDNRFLCLEITHGVFGNGRVWYTDVYGFDYSFYQ